jgi:hypothetical protein
MTPEIDSNHANERSKMREAQQLDKNAVKSVGQRSSFGVVVEGEDGSGQLQDGYACNREHQGKMMIAQDLLPCKSSTARAEQMSVETTYDCHVSASVHVHGMNQGRQMANNNKNSNSNMAFALQAGGEEQAHSDQGGASVHVNHKGHGERVVRCGSFGASADRHDTTQLQHPVQQQPQQRAMMRPTASFGFTAEEARLSSRAPHAQRHHADAVYTSQSSSSTYTSQSSTQVSQHDTFSERGALGKRQHPGYNDDTQGAAGKTDTTDRVHSSFGHTSSMPGMHTSKCKDENRQSISSLHSDVGRVSEMHTGRLRDDWSCMVQVLERTQHHRLRRQHEPICRNRYL